MEFEEFATEEQVRALLPTMNRLDCCRCAYHGYGRWVKIVAPRLLELCNEPGFALMEFAGYLRTHFPGFTIRGVGTMKGEPFYEPQRLYNNLDYHYRHIKKRSL